MDQLQKLTTLLGAQDLLSRRVFLRRTLVAGAVVPASIALLSACGDDDDTVDEPDEEPAVDPVDDEDVDVDEDDEEEDVTDDEDEPADDDSDTDAQQGGFFATPIIDNPQMWPAVGGLPNIIVNKLLFSTVIKFDDPDLLPVGDLAENWDISEDGLEWTFNLKDNAYWHDGEPVTADDIAFTVNGVWVNPDVPYYLRGNLSMIREAEVVGDHEVVLHLHEPAYSLPWMMGYLANVLPEHLLGDWDPDQFSDPQEFTRNPIGSGAFKFEEFSPGSHVRLVRNEDFYDGAPNLDGVIIRVIPDVEQQFAQLQAGELDMVVVEPHQLDAVEGREGIRIQEATQVNYTYLAFNNEMEPFDDPLVRRAFVHATDRQGILDNAQLGRGILANHPISPFMDWVFTDDTVNYEYDPELAGELLDEAGWVLPDGGEVREKDGQPLRVVLEVDRGNPVREQTAIFAQQDWRDIGVDCEIETSPFNDLLSRVRAGDDADVQAFIMWYITPPHPDITAYYACGESTNTFFYCNERVDELLAEARRTEDMDAQVELHHEVQQIIAEDAPVVFLYYPYELQALNDSVHNWASLGFRDALSHMVDVWKEQ